MRRKHFTKRERRRIAEDEALAESMEKALRPGPVHLDFETGQTVTGRMSSSQPNLQYFQRPGATKIEIAEDLLEKLRSEYPDLADYLWADLGFKVRAAEHPGMLAAIDVLHKADYASMERHVLAYIHDSSDWRSRYETLLLSAFGDDPLTKMVEFDEQAQEEALRQEISALVPQEGRSR